MELNTPVEAKDGKFDVEANTETGIKTELLIKVIDMEDRLLGILGGVGLKVPDVTQVEEGGTMHDAPYREAEFEVGLEFHITELGREGGVGFGNGTRAEGTRGPAAHTVRASGIEEAVEGDGIGVAIGTGHTAIDATGQGRLFTQHHLVAEAQITTQILRIANPEEGVVIASLALIGEETLRKVEQVACTLKVEAEERSVSSQVATLVVVGVAERKARNKLGFVAVDKVLILRRGEEGPAEALLREFTLLRRGHSAPRHQTL